MVNVNSSNISFDHCGSCNNQSVDPLAGMMNWLSIMGIALLLICIL